MGLLIKANLVLQDTVERIYAGDMYAEVPCGIYVIRGENVVLLGEVCLETEDDIRLRRVDVEEVRQIQKQEREARLQQDKRRDQVLYKLGFSADFAETDLY
jgi:U6 snRNA-associated Sm-like protein LSm1